jgi:hypothetical protein
MVWRLKLRVAGFGASAYLPFVYLGVSIAVRRETCRPIEEANFLSNFRTCTSFLVILPSPRHSTSPGLFGCRRVIESFPLDASTGSNMIFVPPLQEMIPS